MKLRTFILCILLSGPAISNAQLTDVTHKQDIVVEDPNDPFFFIDSIRVNKGALQEYDASGIASVTVYKDSSIIKKMEPSAKTGIVYIETKKFAKQRYWNYFRLKSARYAELIPTIESDKDVQYILNKRVLKNNFEGDLAAINDTVFRALRILTKQELVEDFGIDDKKLGVVITSVVTPTLFDRRNKF